MKTGPTMTLIGLAAIGADCLFVGSIFALLVWGKHDGAGIVLDILFAVLIADGVLLLRYGGRLHQFIARLHRDNLWAASHHGHRDRRPR